MKVWTVLSSIGTVVAALAAAIGLIGTWRGLRHNTRALELQVLESIFRDIRELDAQYLTDFATWAPAKRTAWSATFFNTVEYLCFIINRKITSESALRKFFFDEGLPAWRKQFDEHVKSGIIRDAHEMFPEFKKAYRDATTYNSSFFDRLKKLLNP